MDLKGLRLMSNSIKKILLIINIVILFVVTGFFANKEESYKKLDSYFYLELTPVDPRSFLQGDYMTLNYDITLLFSRIFMQKWSTSISRSREGLTLILTSWRTLLMPTTYWV